MMTMMVLVVVVVQMRMIFVCWSGFVGGDGGGCVFARETAIRFHLERRAFTQPMPIQTFNRRRFRALLEIYRMV